MIRPLGDYFECFFYQGTTPTRRPANLQLRSDSLVISFEDAEPIEWLYSEVKLAWDGAYGEPARIERRVNGSETIVVHDSNFVDSLRQRVPEIANRPWWDLRLEGWPAVMMSCIIVMILGSVLYFWAVPLAADTVARFAPQTAEERLGLAVVNLEAPLHQRCSDPAKEKLLARVVDRLAAAAGTKYNFKVIYARLGMMNAFAAPGGYIVVSDSLLRVTQTPEEFAGVLAHEMQHVLHKHSTRALAREMGGRAILSLLAVDSTGTPMAFEGASKLVNLGFQRSDEEQADEDAISLLTKSKIRPTGLATFLERLQGDSSTTAMRYFSTHPATTNRVERLRSMTASAVAYSPLMTAEEWEFSRTVCVTPKP